MTENFDSINPMSLEPDELLGRMEISPRGLFIGVMNYRNQFSVDAAIEDIHQLTQVSRDRIWHDLVYFLMAAVDTIPTADLQKQYEDFEPVSFPNDGVRYLYHEMMSAFMSVFMDVEVDFQEVKMSIDEIESYANNPKE